jgi:hypothetical protein
VALKLADIAPYDIVEERSKIASPERRPKHVLRAHLDIVTLLRRLLIRSN